LNKKRAIPEKHRRHLGATFMRAGPQAHLLERSCQQYCAAPKKSLCHTTHAKKLRGKIMSIRILPSSTEHTSSDISPSADAAKALLADIRKLAPDIASRAIEIETARRIPADIVEMLKSAGVFRMFVPRTYGGLEFDLPVGLEILAELAKIDGSVGWNAMTSSNGSLFAPFLPQQTYEIIYQSGPDVTFAGATQPAGTAEAVSSQARGR
jgi:alkylation response protein AidB-like acyl-CoA dehydrogenase